MTPRTTAASPLQRRCNVEMLILGGVAQVQRNCITAATIERRSELASRRCSAGASLLQRPILTRKRCDSEILRALARVFRAEARRLRSES